MFSEISNSKYPSKFDSISSPFELFLSNIISAPGNGKLVLQSNIVPLINLLELKMTEFDEMMTAKDAKNQKIF